MKMSTGKHSLKLHLVLLALLIAVVGFVIWLYTGYVGESTPYEVTNYAMGTYVQQTVYGKNGQAGASAAANAISSLENEISWRVDGSEIQKLNEQAGGDPVKVSQENWRISVRDPDKSVDDSDAGMGVLELSEGFVSTSGVYEKYFEQDGILYHHLLDPSTGYPAENNLLSVSVVAQTGVLSDLLSTACFVLGLDNSLSVLEHYDAQAIFITRDKEVYITEGLKDRFTVSSQAYTLKELQ